MKKSWLLLIAIALLSSATVPLFGLDAGGCVQSPENPTAILAAVGSAGALFVSVRARIKARRNSPK